MTTALVQVSFAVQMRQHRVATAPMLYQTLRGLAHMPQPLNDVQSCACVGVAVESPSPSKEKIVAGPHR